MTGTSASARLLPLVRATGGALLLAGLLAGMPLALTRWGAGLLPGHWPGGRALLIMLENPLPSTLLELLVLAGWGIWVVLALSTARELCWYAAHLPALLRQGGDLGQLTARRGVAAVLLAALVLGLVASLRAVPPAPQHGPGLVTAAFTRPVATAPAVSGQAPTTTASVAATAPAVCEVRRGDTLWDLARRHLDDPLRWKEIYELNHGLVQADGRALRDPDWIYPGWRLQLPSSPRASAPPSAPGSGTAPTGTPRGTATAPSPSGTAAAAPTAAPPLPSGSTHTPVVPGPSNATHASRPAGSRLPGGAGYIDAALLAALSGAAALLLARRRARPHQPAEPRAYQQPQPAGPEEAPLVDAVRHLHRLQGSNTQAPSEGSASLAASGDTTLSLSDLLDRSPTRQLSLTGPGGADAVRALLASVLTAATPTEHLVVPATDLDELAPALTGTRFPQLLVAADGEAALTALEEHALRAARARHGGDTAPFPRLVLVADLDQRQHQRLAALLRTDQWGTLAAVHPRPTPDADHYVIADDGLCARQPVSGGETAAQTLRFFHLRTQAADTLLRLVRAHREETTEPNPPSFPRGTESNISVPLSDGAETPTEIPSPAIQEEPPLPEGHSGTFPPVAPVAAPRSAATPAGTAVATATSVRLNLLGPLTVEVRGEPLERGIRGNVGDLLAYLAVHPEGRSKDAIITALWPEQDDPEAAAKTFDNTKSTARGALRAALEHSRSIAVFVQSGSLWRLDPNLISSDLDDLREAFRQAHAAGRDAEARLDACRRIAELDTGVLHATSDSEWLDIHREDLRRRTLDALNILAGEPGLAPEQVLVHLDHALRLDPYNDQLYLRQARLHADLGNPDAVRRTMNRLQQRLKEISTRPDPAVLGAFHLLLGSPAPASGSTPARLRR
ncbi:DNA-binding SARP family transcriptional activator/LysM repeat protein [Streptacidiphilus sp. MAP12-16]|uniref:LysM peptidoglycan-binding domain-containing protein n=1 Tax=Streptacidiphilus sp. MAP12-16 TaxID=3156300 RepID=UPI003517E17B